MTQMIAMPAVMTEEMRNHWRSAFISGLHNRRGRGPAGDARRLKHPSAEEAAWASLVKKYGRPIEDAGPARTADIKGRLEVPTEAGQPHPTAWFLGWDGAGPVVTDYADRPEDLKERYRLMGEIALLTAERDMLPTVVFNEHTFDAKTARLDFIKQSIAEYEQQIDFLDSPTL